MVSCHTTILVTGGAGFIGSNFIRMALLKYNYNIINLDSLTYAGNLENLSDIENHPRYTFIRGDITDKTLVSELCQQVNYIINFAAESHVDRSILDSSRFIMTNIVGTHVLLDAALNSPIKKMVHVSTDEVYGSLPLGSKELKFTEKSLLNPSSPYSASKASSDMIALSYFCTHGLPVVVTRCSNNFGPYQFPEKIIPLFVTNLMLGKKIPLYGNGSNVRDWIHVSDHCEALLMTMQNGISGSIYNIGSSCEMTNLELTQCILQIMGKDNGHIEKTKDRPGHDLRYAVNCDKLKHDIGWKPKYLFHDALFDTVQWYIQHTKWWEHVRTGEYLEYYQQQYEIHDTEKLS